MSNLSLGRKELQVMDVTLRRCICGDSLICWENFVVEEFILRTLVKGYEKAPIWALTTGVLRSASMTREFKWLVGLGFPCLIPTETSCEMCRLVAKLGKG